jgi:hypothetical protein
MDACDPAQVWTTSHCQDQSSPELIVQNLTFRDGNSTGQTYEGGGGGAIFDRGGRLKVIDSRFIGNRTDGDLHTVTIAGTVIASNQAKEGGGAVFFVSNDKTGTLRIEDSTLRHNLSSGFGTPGYPGIFFPGAGQPVVVSSTLS